VCEHKLTYIPPAQQARELGYIEAMAADDTVIEQEDGDIEAVTTL
jgi:hypothetical protein